MPLREGNTTEIISANIRELIDKWEETGTINNRSIETREEAVRVATAIALRQADQFEED